MRHIILMILLFAPLAICPGQATAQASAFASAPVQAFQSDRILVTTQGSGPDVILIPGLASSAAVWDDTVKQLQSRYRLHVIQVAGFAGAPAGANAEGPILQPAVDALDGYIRSAKLKSPAVIGHSMGGLMGLMLARQHPEDVGRLMVIDSLPFYAVLFSPQATVESVKPQAAAMRDMAMKSTPDQWAAGQARTMTRLVKSPTALKAATQAAIASDPSVTGRACSPYPPCRSRPSTSRPGAGTPSEGGADISGGAMGQNRWLRGVATVDDDRFPRPAGETGSPLR